SKVYKDLTPIELNYLKETKFIYNLEERKINIPIGRGFNKRGNKIFLKSSDYSDFEVKNVDVETFEAVGNRYAKDKNNAYVIFGKELLIIEGADSKTFKEIDIFGMDDTSLYFLNKSIISSKEIEILAIYNG